MLSVGCSEVLGLEPTAPADAFESLCGNGTRDPGEDCDDGNNRNDGNGCDALCKKNAVCGDTFLQPLYELCDDGNKGDEACSDDCKRITIERIGEKYGAAFDFNKDGTPDAYQDPLSGQQTVKWDPPFGTRVVFEVDLQEMPSTLLLKAAYFAFSACCTTVEVPIKLHGYAGDGKVEFPDFTNTGILGGFIRADDTAQVSIEVTSFAQTLLSNRSPFAGFLLRAESETTVNLSVYTPLFGVPSKYPRFIAQYCLDADANKMCD